MYLLLSVLYAHTKLTRPTALFHQECVCVQGGEGVFLSIQSRLFYHPLSVLYTHAEKTYSTEHIFPPRGRSCSYIRALFLIEVPVIYQQSERSRISVLGGNGFASVSMMFNFNPSDGVISFCFSLFS